MILTLPASVTVVAAMAWEPAGKLREFPGAFLLLFLLATVPLLSEIPGRCWPGRDTLPLPFAPCGKLAHGILVRPLLLNEAALPMEPPKILQGKREGGRDGEPLPGLHSFGKGWMLFPWNAPRPPFTSIK